MYIVYRSHPITNDSSIDLEICFDTEGLLKVDILYPEEEKEYTNPSDAARAAITLRSKVKRNTKSKNILFRVVAYSPCYIGAEVLCETKLPNRLLKWADNEYKTLHKCQACLGILPNQNDFYKFLGRGVFCSDTCRTQATKDAAERLNDNDETEFDL